LYRYYYEKKKETRKNRLKKIALPSATRVFESERLCDWCALRLLLLSIWRLATTTHRGLTILLWTVAIGVAGTAIVVVCTATTSTVMRCHIPAATTTAATAIA
jgi:hypothetical protein